MNTDEKIEFDAIFALQEMISKRINYRQGAEWKLTIALWSVLSILIGTAITGKISFSHPQCLLIFTIIGITIICVLYILNLIGVSKYQQYQLTILADFDQRLFKLSNTEESERSKTTASKYNKYYKHWSIILRIVTTIILLVGTVLAVYTAGANN